MSLRISGAEHHYRKQGAAGRERATRKPRLSAISLILICVGTATWAWTALDLVFRATASDFNGRFCLPMAVGIGLTVWGALLESEWKSFGGWFSLALIGQAASLQMIDAGRLIHFQHYRSFSDLLQSDPFALVFLIVQIICVAVGISARRSELRGWCSKHLRGWRIASVFIFLALSSAAVTPDLSKYGRGVLIGTLVQVVNLGSVILLAWSVPNRSIALLREKIDWILGGARNDRLIQLDRFAVIMALWVVTLTGALSYFVYQAHPHVPDETQYVFQANYMAAGQLSVEAPAVPEGFAMYMVPYREARWYGIFPPGWPALLALGTLLGINWLVNPLLTGLTVLLAYILFQQLYSRSEARLAVLLLCCSPWLLFMGMSYMSHISTLAFALLAAVLLMRGIRCQKTVYSLAAGLVIGVVFLIRPLDGAIVGLILGVAGFFGSPAGRPRILASAGLLIGAVASALLILPYNQVVTGSASVSPSDAYYNSYVGPNVMALGFGPERGMHWPLDAFPGHSPLEAAINAVLNIFQLNTELFGWATGSLLLVALLVVAGRILKRDLWAWGSILAVAGTYSLFWYHGGPDFGARYWFLCIVPLVTLTVRGLEYAASAIDSIEESGPAIYSRVVLGAAMLCFLSLAAYVPWRASDKYYEYLGMEPGIRRLAQAHGFGKSLVLIRGNEHPDYQSAWIYNPLDFAGDAPIYAFDKSPEIRAELLRNYPDRQLWIVDGPTIADGEYRVIQGPLGPDAVVAEPGK